MANIPCFIHILDVTRLKHLFPSVCHAFLGLPVFFYHSHRVIYSSQPIERWQINYKEFFFIKPKNMRQTMKCIRFKPHQTVNMFPYGDYINYIKWPNRKTEHPEMSIARVVTLIPLQNDVFIRLNYKYYF